MVGFIICVHYWATVSFLYSNTWVIFTKFQTRKNDTKRKDEILNTGRGLPPPEENNPITEQVPTINLEIKNDFDSDCLKKNMFLHFFNKCIYVFLWEWVMLFLGNPPSDHNFEAVLIGGIEGKQKSIQD